MKLEAGTESDREYLAEERAIEWRGRLTSREFGERNRRLYQHPFGRSRVKTWIWRDGGPILSSLDTVSIRLRLGKEVRDAWLIASVVTPKAQRGRGHATKMLEALFASDPSRAALLFSDIEPAFYDRLGFKLALHEEVEALSAVGGGGQLRPISADAFLQYQKWHRGDSAGRLGGQAACLEPDPELWDWQLERFRFFSSLKGKPWEGDAFFETDHAHVLALAPDPVHDRLDALWLAEDCSRCVEAGAARASALSLGRLRYWRPWNDKSTGHRECPMVRVPGVPGAVPALGVQLGDWW